MTRNFSAPDISGDTSFSTAHLPRLSDERIAQMSEFACRHAQEPSGAAQDYGLVRRLRDFVVGAIPVPLSRATAGMALAVMLCLGVLAILPPATPITPQTGKQKNTALQDETDISEYLIHDFLDEIV